MTEKVTEERERGEGEERGRVEGGKEDRDLMIIFILYF